MPKEYILKLEVAFIKNYDTTNYANGYNVSPGGDHWTPTPEGRRRLSEGIQAYYDRMTAEEREAYSKATAIRMSKLHKGRKQSAERAEKSRKALQKAHSIPRSPEYLEMLSKRKKAWWDARKAAGLTGNIAYTKNPDLRPPLKEKPKRDKPWQRLKPVSDEHREKVAQKKREWWAAKKAAGLTSFESIMGKPKKGGYKLTFTDEHKAKLSANKKAFYAKQKELPCP